MSEFEKEREELLSELAKKFRDSAKQLHDIALRIDRAAAESHKSNQHFEHSNRHLRESLGCDSTIPFTYLEFLEFVNAEEFNRFRTMPLITEEEIKEVDLDKLLSDLSCD